MGSVPSDIQAELVPQTIKPQPERCSSIFLQCANANASPSF